MTRAPSRLTIVATFAFLATAVAATLLITRERPRPAEASSAPAAVHAANRPAGRHVTRAFVPQPAAVLAPEPRALPPPDERSAAQLESFRDRLAARLRSEPSDPVWAARSADEFKRRLAESGHAGLSLVDITCSTSLCGLRLQVQPELGGLDSLKLAINDFPWPTSGFVSPEEPGKVTMYVTREGHTLPSLR